MDYMILILLFIKHFLWDFVWQPPYMYLNKGTYGHPGGILHATCHALPTMGILLAFGLGPISVLAIGVLEFLVHYHMDWFKMMWCKRKGYGPTTSEKWFWWLGFDQTVHSLTYVMIAWCYFPLKEMS